MPCSLRRRPKPERGLRLQLSPKPFYEATVSQRDGLVAGMLAPNAFGANPSRGHRMVQRDSCGERRRHDWQRGCRGYEDAISRASTGLRLRMRLLKS